MVGGGEEDGSCVRRGHRGNCGDITTTMTYFPISFTHQKSTARCVYCLKPFWCCLPGQRQSLCGGSRWLPCSCHCLSTRKRLPPFSAHTKSRLRRVFLREAQIRALCAPVEHRLPFAKNQPSPHARSNYPTRWILAAVTRPWSYVCRNPPPPQRKKRKPSAEEYERCVSRTLLWREVEMAAC